MAAEPPRAIARIREGRAAARLSIVQGKPDSRWQAAEVLPELIGLVYEGINESEPWFGLAERLRHLYAACNVAITLHHADDLPHDTQVMSLDPDNRTDWLLAERIYRERFRHIELLRPESVAPGTLVEFGAGDVERECAEHFVFLGIGRCLRTCFAEPGGMRCWVDVVRPRQLPELPYSSEERRLLQQLVAHLSRALGLYARMRRQETEKSLYEGSLDHLVLGCLLLDGDGQVIGVNHAAKAIIAQHQGIDVAQGRLQIQDREAHQVLEAAIARAMPRGAIHKPSRRANGSAGRRATACCWACWSRRAAGAVLPGAACAERDPALSEPPRATPAHRSPCGYSPELIAQLFELTRQEARLAAWLATGRTISEAAAQMASR
jgi:PAS domain-containing protein